MSVLARVVKYFALCEDVLAIGAMQVISPKKLKEFWQRHPDAEEPLRRWLTITQHAAWQSLAETRQDFPHADLAGDCTIFNVKGNSYRLITIIFYPRQKAYVRFVLTHPEYDKGHWREDCRC